MIKIKSRILEGIEFEQWLFGDIRKELWFDDCFVSLFKIESNGKCPCICNTIDPKNVAEAIKTNLNNQVYQHNFLNDGTVKKNGKGRSANIARVAPAFFVDIDPAKDKNKKPLATPVQIKKAVDAINKFLPYSGLVFSGFGFQIYYHLGDDFQEIDKEGNQKNRDFFKAYWRKLFDILKTFLDQKGFKNIEIDYKVIDFARIMRTPGTTHLKDPKNPVIVRFVETTGIYYKFKDLCSWIDDTHNTMGLKELENHAAIRRSGGMNGSANTKEVRKIFNNLLKTLDLHDGLRISDKLLDDMDARFPDRDKPGFLKAFTGEKIFKDNTPSERDYSLINYGKIFGLSDQETLALIIHSRVKNGDDLHLNNLQKYARSIARIRAAKKIKVDVKHLPLPFIKTCFDDGQQGDADLYFELNKHKFRYDNKNVKGNKKRKWFTWNGAFWQNDDRQYLNAVSLLIPEYQHYIFSVHKEIKKLDPAENKAEIKALKKLIDPINKRINSIKRVNVKKDIVENAVIRHSEFLNTEWDNNINLLPFLNGVFSLETFKFEDSKRENYNQKVFPYDYDPDARCPTFDMIINAQFGEPAALAMNHGEPLSQKQKDDVKNMKNYFQILNSLCLPGDNEQQNWIINHGPAGRNGKSKIYEALRVTMGDYGSPMADKLIMKTKYASDHTDSLQGLKGMRFVINSDTRGELDTSKICKITGGDSYYGRGLFEDGSTQAPPTFLMYLQINKRPMADGNAAYFWERTQLVTWRHRFLNKPDPLKPWEHERDVTIGNKVNLEYQGIMNWLIAGFKKYVEAGRKINQPESVQKALTEYKFSFDGLEEFYEYYVAPSPGAAFSTKEAHEIYLSFAEELSLPKPIRNNITFTKLLVERFRIKKTKKDEKIVPTIGLAAMQPTRDTAGNVIDTRCTCFLGVNFSPDF